MFVDVDVDVDVGANMIVAALGNGNDIVGVIDLSWTRRSRELRMRDLSAARESRAAQATICQRL
jgi:hypothetical protein